VQKGSLVVAFGTLIKCFQVISCVNPAEMRETVKVGNLLG